MSSKGNAQQEASRLWVLASEVLEVEVVVSCWALTGITGAGAGDRRRFSCRSWRSIREEDDLARGQSPSLLVSYSLVGVDVEQLTWRRKK